MCGLEGRNLAVASFLIPLVVSFDMQGYRKGESNVFLLYIIFILNSSVFMAFQYRKKQKKETQQRRGENEEFLRELGSGPSK